MSDIPNPPQDPPAGPPEPPQRNPPPEFNYGYDPSAAARKVNGPAIAIMVVALISALWCIASIISGLTTSVEEQMAMQREIMNGFGMPMDDATSEKLIRMSSYMGVFFWGFFLLIDLFLFFAAMQMRALKNYRMAMIAAVICIIPCCWSACFILNMPFGIWALVVLMNPEVKDAFES